MALGDWFPSLAGTLKNAFKIGPKSTRLTLDASGLTAARNLAAPDASGTIALISDVPSITGLLVKANNLSDVASAATARANLGLGSVSDVTFANLTLVGSGVTIAADPFPSGMPPAAGYGHLYYNGTYLKLWGDGGVVSQTVVTDPDTTLAANSDAKVATQKAVKAYVAAHGRAVEVPVGCAATTVFDCALAEVPIFDVTVDLAAPLFQLTGAYDGQKIVIRCKQDSSGGRVPTWYTDVRFGTSVRSTPWSSGGGVIDLVGAIYTAAGGGRYMIAAFSRGYVL